MKITFFAVFVVVALLSIGLIQATYKHTVEVKIHVMGSETPGIGGTREHPDTCLAWFNKDYNRVEISYLH